MILAVLNEVRNLPPLIDRVQRILPPEHEILVIDDGSTDGTRQFVQELAGRDPRILPIFHDGPQTLIPAQCQGIRESRGDWVVILDGDLQHPPETIPELLSRLDEGCVLAVASRYHGGGSSGDRPPIRGLLSRGAEAAARTLVPPARWTSDPLSGFFAFRRSVFRPIDPRYRGYKLLLFILCMAEKDKTSDVPYRFNCRPWGESKITEGLGFIRIFLTELILVHRYGVKNGGRPLNTHRVPEDRRGGSRRPQAIVSGPLAPQANEPRDGR